MFRSEGLAKALTDAGYSVSSRTVDRWKAGESRPSKGHLQAIRELVGATQNAAPSEEGAAAELLRLWTGAQAPAWAQGLADAILNAVARTQQTFLEQAAVQYADLAERLLGPDSDAGESPGSAGPQPRRPGPRIGPSA